MAFFQKDEDEATLSLNFDWLENLKKAVSNSDIIFICVGTPTKKGGSSADLRQIYSVSKEISS